MKFEFSAGGVVFRKTPKNTIEILVAQHSQHHAWVFPKGLIGDREDNKHQTKEETALREVKEETGIDAEILEELPSTMYWYSWEGEKRKKTVYYYLMKSLGGNEQERDMEMEAVEWLPEDKVMDRLTHKGDKTVWKVAREKIQRLVSSPSTSSG